MEPGSIVFTKKFTQRSKGIQLCHSVRRGKEAICLAIGTYDTKDPLPSHNQLVGLMGEIGYFPGDLLVEVFGEKGFQKLTKAFLAKYDK